MTDQPTPESEPEDLAGAYTPDPPIGCLLPASAPEPTSEALGGPQGASHASDGPAGRQDAHGGTEGAREDSEPDNPAAWALARHIADHPVSTVQAAFRYLNAPLVIELHEETTPRTTPDNAATSSDTTDNPLREQIGAAIVQGGGCVDLVAATDAVMAVRDREMERMKLLVAASESPGHAVRMAANYADKAIENGERADQLAGQLAALKRAHVALATQAGRDQAALARVRVLAEEHPVSIPTNLVDTALDQPQEQP